MTGNGIKVPTAVFALLSSQVESADFSDEACAEKFVDAESVIEHFEYAMSTRSANLPTREEIGLACFWLLYLADCSVKAYWSLVFRLLTPSRGMSMNECLPDVIAMRDHAVKLAEAAAKRTAPPIRTAALEEDSGDSVPF